MTSRTGRARSGVFSDADPHLARGIGGIDRMYACATGDQDHRGDRYCTGESYFLAVTLALHLNANQNS